MTTDQALNRFRIEKRSFERQKANGHCGPMVETVWAVRDTLRGNLYCTDRSTRKAAFHEAMVRTDRALSEPPLNDAEREWQEALANI